jgi:hypothetical protein
MMTPKARFRALRLASALRPGREAAAHSHGYEVWANGSWPLDLSATTPTMAWTVGAIV